MEEIGVFLVVFMCFLLLMWFYVCLIGDVIERARGLNREPYEPAESSKNMTNLRRFANGADKEIRAWEIDL